MAEDIREGTIPDVVAIFSLPSRRLEARAFCDQDIHAYPLSSRGKNEDLWLFRQQADAWSPSVPGSGDTTPPEGRAIPCPR